MTPADAAWEALAEELRRDYGNVSTRLLLARHRPLIEAAMTLEAEDRREDYVSVRRYSGGVFADGTTNHHPIDYEAEAALTPPPAEPTLDVERLARALGSVVPEPDDEHEYTVTDDLWYAAAIAREYAKEPQP